MQILYLLLLASCGRVADDADDSVTAKLPLETGVADRPEPSARSPLPDEAAPDGAPADVQPAKPQANIEPESARSRYTSLEPASCKPVEGSADGAGSSRRRCDGFAGYALETSETEQQQALAIIAPDGERSELDLSGIATNASLGKLAEWRRAATGEPRALIVRLSAAKKPMVSSLIVAKLDPPACIVAVIARGPGQNEKARAAADRKKLECRTL